MPVNKVSIISEGTGVIAVTQLTHVGTRVGRILSHEINASTICQNIKSRKGLEWFQDPLFI